MSFGSIYKIIFPNGKHYIGLTTTSLEQRTKQHKQSAKSGDTKCLCKALRKYDMVETFELIEIDTADTLEELCEKEIRYIAEYNSYYMNGNGYNMTYGGEGNHGYVFTEEDKQKISEAQKKRFENPEEIENCRQSQKKRFENPEARRHASEISKKQWENQDARQQMSEIKKKYFENNPEVRERMSEIKKQYHENNPEARKEHSKKMKQHWENQEAREQMSEIKKKYFENNPEARERMSEIKKQHFEEHPECKNKALDSTGKNKPFDVFTKDGIFIKTFTYQYEAKEYLQKEYDIKSIDNITSVLSGKRKSSAGFVFKYK